ncbi:hypothetical protein AB0F91_43295 [Amycolatopsis sp. NPDC023774]
MAYLAGGVYEEQKINRDSGATWVAGEGRSPTAYAAGVRVPRGSKWTSR